MKRIVTARMRKLAKKSPDSISYEDFLFKVISVDRGLCFVCGGRMSPVSPLHSFERNYRCSHCGHEFGFMLPGS